MADIIHRVGAKIEISEVYKALTNIDLLSKWWTQNTSGDCQIGKIINFDFFNPKGELLGGFKMEVLEQNLNQNVVWKCVDGPEDWINTTLEFKLKKEDNFTIINFGHRNWREANEHMAHCSTKWGIFLMSLKSFLENGKGNPAPHDIQINNWH